MFDWITQASLRNRMLAVAAYVVVLVVGLVGELPPPPQAMPMDKQAESRLSRVLEVTAA